LTRLDSKLPSDSVKEIENRKACCVSLDVDSPIDIFVEVMRANCLIFRSLNEQFRYH
jgi:general stress protein 26